MTIEDVPIPIIIPFGLFPNKKGQTSGILVPTYGESRDRGFYLENGGYYFGINDYMELKLIGDIYSRGSWALKPTFNYKKRYKFSGSFNFNYAINTSGIRETESFTKKRDFRLTWTHRQDPKARPKSQFNASVNFGSSTFNKYNPVSRNDLLTNTFGSSVSYSTTFFDKVSFTAALRHSQNTSNKTVNMTLPDISMAVNRFYPLRKPGKASDLKWYDNISMQYNVNVKNEVDTYDSLLFTKRMMEGFRNGVQHRVPVNLTLKVLKYFTLSNTLDFSERWYSTSVIQTWVNDTLFGKVTKIGYVRVDTISGFKAAHEYGFSSTLNTNLYGMLQFRRGPVRAIRHVIRPSVSFSYRPDFGSDKLGYFRTVQIDTLGNFRRYSIFGNDAAYSSVIGVPTDAKSGRLNFSIITTLK
jgi:lipopolysaccharide assembly outer membrane protein LptD (OstA)